LGGRWLHRRSTTPVIGIVSAIEACDAIEIAEKIDT
jgi:hypothetical protein